MKRLLTVLAILTLMAMPTGLKAQDTALTVNMNVGANYDSDTEAFGASVMALKKLGGGWFEISVQASFGEASNSIGVMPGIFLLESPHFSLGLLQGVVSKWEPLGPNGDLINYIMGSTGLYLAYDLPWNIVGQETCLYGMWQREYPSDSENLVEATNRLGVGLSLAIR
jgi:hypothetical protein